MKKLLGLFQKKFNLIHILVACAMIFVMCNAGNVLAAILPAINWNTTVTEPFQAIGFGQEYEFEVEPGSQIQYTGILENNGNLVHGAKLHVEISYKYTEILDLIQNNEQVTLPREEKIDTRQLTTSESLTVTINAGVGGDITTYTNQIIDVRPTEKIITFVNIKVNHEAYTGKIKLKLIFDRVAPAVPPSITVTSPNGGETWEIGKPYNIQWEAVGFSSKDLLYITLIQMPGFHSDNPMTYSEWKIADVPNTGTYNWTVPPTLEGEGSFPVEEGNIYKIRIYNYLDRFLYDESDDYFTIHGSTPSITFISPSGGETYAAGQNVTIKYSTRFFPRPVKVQIQLNKGANYPSGPYYPVGDATPYVEDTGSYNFTIPTNAISGNDYSFMINSDYPGTEISATFGSNLFTVVSAATTAPGSLRVYTDANTSISKAVIEGTTVEFAKVKFMATDEDVKITSITFTKNGTGPDSNIEAGKVFLYDGTTKLAETGLGTSSPGKATFYFAASNAPIIPKLNSKVLTLKAVVSNYITAVEGSTIGFDIAEASKDVGAIGAESCHIIIPTGSSIGNKMTVFATVPQITLNADSPSGNQIPGVNQEVLRFDVTMPATGLDGYINSVKFTIRSSNNGAGNKTFNLYKSTDLNTILYSFVSDNSVNDSFCFVTFVAIAPPSAILLPDGSATTFVLKGDTSQMDQSTNNEYLRVGIEAHDISWSDGFATTNYDLLNLPVNGASLTY